MIFDLDDLDRIDADTDRDEARPKEGVEFANAKAYLQTTSTFSGDNLYDHLTDVLNKILAERPENVIDFFEEYSRKVKEKRFRPLTDHLEDIFVPPGKYALAKKVLPLLKPIQSGEPSTQDPEDLELADMSRNDMVQLLYFFEHAGVGLPRSEMYYLTLSMRQLVYTEPIISIRFWGKIYGLYKDYIIIEAEFKEEEIMKRNEEIQDTEVVEAQDAVPQEEPPRDEIEDLERDQELGGEGITQKSKIPRPLPPPPTIDYSLPPEPPSEFTGVGVNKKVYYVCNSIGDKWEQLPNVTPKQIQVARKIYMGFTGNLDHQLITYPEFPGQEREYLRAQIARISAGTQISPLGFYTFGGGGEGEEEEEEEEAEEAVEGPKTTYKENPKYDPVPIKDLVDGSMAFWVHHTMYILPQGRTTWWNPNPLPEGEGMDEELGEAEEEEKPKVAGPEPETGPPLLTPCSEDASLEAVPAWSVRCSSNILEEFAIAIVRSHLWPGAYCFSNQGKTFANIYFGYGLKYQAHNFSPMPLPPVQQDYPIGPEIMEILDPTGAEEETWRIAHLPKPPPEMKPMAGEGAEEEEEEEDEDEDDD